MLIRWLVSTQKAQYMLLFLVLEVHSDWLQFYRVTHSYTSLKWPLDKHQLVYLKETEMKSFQSWPVTLAHLQTAGSCTLTLLVERPLSHTDTYSVVGHLHHQSLNETGSLQLYLTNHGPTRVGGVQKCTYLFISNKWEKVYFGPIFSKYRRIEAAQSDFNYLSCKHDVLRIELSLSAFQSSNPICCTQL